MKVHIKVRLNDGILTCKAGTGCLRWWHESPPVGIHALPYAIKHRAYTGGLPRRQVEFFSTARGLQGCRILSNPAADTGRGARLSCCLMSSQRPRGPSKLLPPRVSRLQARQQHFSTIVQNQLPPPCQKIASSAAMSKTSLWAPSLPLFLFSVHYLSICNRK